MTDPMSTPIADAEDTWHKVHGEYLETVLHRAVLIAADDPDPALRRTGVAEHTERMRDLAGELDQLGAPAPLERLVALGGLSPLERETLGLALAAELDPELLGSLVARFGDRTTLTPTVVGALLGLAPSETADLADRSGALFRFGLLAESPTSASSPLVDGPLRLTDRVLGHLRGRGALDARLRGLVDPIEPVPVPDRLTAVAHDLAAWLVSDDRPPGPARVDLLGRVGSGRAAVAARAAADIGLALLRLDVERLAGRADRLDLMRVVARELLLLPAALYVEDRSGTTDEPARRAAIDESIDGVDGLVFVGAERAGRWRATSSVALPSLTGSDRTELWRQALGDVAADVDHELVADQFRFGPRTIARVSADARFRADLHRRPLGPGDVRLACRAAAGAGLSTLAERVESRAGWERLVVGESERDVLRALCEHVRHRRVVHDEWGLADSSARGLGTSALFTGPSGTGKTLAAEVIATELDLDLYRIDLASVVSKYIGETEKNLRSVFDAAEQGGAILFFDEADALFGKRTEVKDSHDRYANIEINYLLQRMESHAGLSILATNRKSDLDQAFLRRIRFVVPFPFPRPPARRDIWRTELSAGMPVGDVDLDALARLELSGGNIRNVVVNAAFAAAARGGSVGMDEIVRAAAQEYTKLDKLPTRAEFGHYYEDVVR